MRLNKHGLPIMEVIVNKPHIVVENKYFCHNKSCKGKASNNVHGNWYCDSCYMKYIDYGNHAFD